MGFYKEWFTSTAPEDIEKYIISFLIASQESCDSLLEYDPEELSTAFQILSNSELSLFLETIDKISSSSDLTVTDVLCFSKLENGVSRLNELLEFAPNGLSFAEIGEQLAGSTNITGRIKYGENQSKLAAALLLVDISNSRPAVVKPTAWGSYLTRYRFEEKSNVIKKLILRNHCVRMIIGQALLGSTSFNDLTLFLAPSTRKRRMSNIRTLVTFVLSDSKYEKCLSNINWKIER